MEPNLLLLGDTAWTIEFGDAIDPALHARVLGLAAALDELRAQEEAFAGIVDVVPTFRSLTVHYNPLACDGDALATELMALAKNAGSVSQKGRRWRIPVCFDTDLAPDLDDLAQAKGLGRDEVVTRLCDASFQVYLIGFMPGFPYMGGLPKELEMPRLASPRKAVPARSLAIAGAMCAVYPWESPGGWRLLGRTPIPFFDAANAEPSLLASGDEVQWVAVDRDAFDALERAVEAGRFERASLCEGGA